MRITFEQFMDRVNQHMRAKFYGLDSFDIADYPYRDAYDDGMSPQATATAAIMADDSCG